MKRNAQFRRIAAEFHAMFKLVHCKTPVSSLLGSRLHILNGHHDIEIPD